MGGMYAGLFFTSLAVLMLEILLTRVFSVVTWYYFAFFAISVAMFGITVGALFVYLKDSLFPREKLSERLALFTLLFGLGVDVSLMLFLSIPFFPRLTGVGIFSTAFVYLVISMPFVFAGVVICLCLTRFPERIGLLYAADLIGAAVGAFLIFPVLNAMDAPSAILLVGAVATIGAIAFARSAPASPGSARLVKASSVALVVLTGAMLVNSVWQPVRVEWVKSEFNVPQMEAWNAFSRIAVYPEKRVKRPYSWGLSPAYVQDRVISERMIDIDGVSETVITGFDGDFASVEHLKYDVTAIAHYLKSDARVFVIGVGGGRDILAAKAFGAKTVVGAEINNRTVDIITEVLPNYTGHIHELPGVRIMKDEARSAITRMDEKFDIIQASCIATWSATTAGAFSLAENSLYTVEGWRVFFDHLAPDGVLSFNRWYSPDYPAQLLRLMSLAVKTLRDHGVKDPSKHIALVRSERQGRYMASGTIIVSKSPFQEEAFDRFRAEVERLRFKMVYDPYGPRHIGFEEVLHGTGDPEFYESAVFDLTPPTDDRPFFFYMLKLKDVFKGAHLKFAEQRFNFYGVTMLVVLLIVSGGLSVIFIIGPLLVMRKKVPIPAGGGLVGVAFFGAIGLGYILVEMGMLQRLIIFLGHPIYSITVVLFSMLLASGLGAVASGLFTRGGVPRPAHIAGVMAAAVAMLIFVIYAQTGILAAYEQSGIHARIGLSLLFLMPVGFLLGFPFPFGMSIASAAFREHTPWFWAVNGAMSVVASVLSVCISISWGFTATLLAGLAAYVAAAVALLVFHTMRKGRAAP